MQWHAAFGTAAAACMKSYKSFKKGTPSGTRLVHGHNEVAMGLLTVHFWVYPLNYFGLSMTRLEKTSDGPIKHLFFLVRFISFDFYLLSCFFDSNFPMYTIKYQFSIFVI